MNIPLNKPLNKRKLNLFHDITTQQIDHDKLNNINNTNISNLNNATITKRIHNISSPTSTSHSASYAITSYDHIKDNKNFTDNATNTNTLNNNFKKLNYKYQYNNKRVSSWSKYRKRVMNNAKMLKNNLTDVSRIKVIYCTYFF